MAYQSMDPSWWSRRRELKLRQSQIGALLGASGGTVCRAEYVEDTGINDVYEPLLKELETLYDGDQQVPADRSAVPCPRHADSGWARGITAGSDARACASPRRVGGAHGAVHAVVLLVIRPRWAYAGRISRATARPSRRFRSSVAIVGALPEQAAELSGDVLLKLVRDVLVPLGHVNLRPAHEVHDRTLSDAEHEQERRRRVAGGMCNFEAIDRSAARPGTSLPFSTFDTHDCVVFSRSAASRWVRPLCCRYQRITSPASEPSGERGQPEPRVATCRYSPSRSHCRLRSASRYRPSFAS